MADFSLRCGMIIIRSSAENAALIKALIWAKGSDGGTVKHMMMVKKECKRRQELLLAPLPLL